MSKTNEKPMSNDSYGVYIMEALEKIREKIDSTREEVIKVSTRQEEDRRLHNERHMENHKWRDDHNKKHEEIIEQLKSVDTHIKSIPIVAPSTPIDKNKAMIFGFIITVLFLGLIYALTGNDMPSVSDIATIAAGV